MTSHPYPKTPLRLVPQADRRPPPLVYAATTPAMRAALAALQAQVGEVARAFSGHTTTTKALDRAVLLLERVPGLAAALHNTITKERGQ